MKEINDFIDVFYNNNLEFNNERFLKILDYLLQQIGQMTYDASNFNKILEKMISKYQSNDYYYLIEIMEYELLPILEKDEGYVK